MPDSKLLEEVLTSYKGLGLVATENIKRGTRMISEEPILIVKSGKDTDKNLLQQLLKLSPSKHEQLTNLFDGKQKICPKALANLISELEKHHQYSGKYAEAAGRDLAKLQASISSQQRLFPWKELTTIVYRANAVMLDPEARFGMGIFPIYSRLNHSCTPNAQHSSNATTGKEVVHAIRDIAKGEEVVTSYIPLQRPATQRHEDLSKKWGFECKCETCIGLDREASDERRQRLYEIDQGFAFLENPNDRRVFATAVYLAMLPKSDGQALQWAEESMALLKIEGLVGMEMAKACRECSKYSLKEGQLGKALKYAQQEVEVQVTCLGEETAHLLSDEDANVWIKHIDSLSEADKVRLRMNEKRVNKEQKRVEKKAAKKASKRS